MARERIVTPKALSVEEQDAELTLRPRTLSEMVGQSGVLEKLSIAVEAAKQRDEPLEHVLLHGPPGLGKTTIAFALAREMNTNIYTSSGPALDNPGALMGILSNLEAGDIFFIDEIHRLPRPVEEFIYPALEDFRISFTVGKGAHARILPFQIKHFTLIGATTSAGLLTAPLRGRFGIAHHLDFYEVGELQKIALRSARILKIPIDKAGSLELARRARGTPRIANRLLRRVRDYTQVKADGKINQEIARKALALEGVDEMGLDDLDRQLLHTIIDFYKGGPVGIQALAATLNEEADTLREMVEPYLLKIGFLGRTRTGRVANQSAYEHLKISPDQDNQKKLFP